MQVFLRFFKNTFYIKQRKGRSHMLQVLDNTKWNYENADALS